MVVTFKCINRMVVMVKCINSQNGGDGQVFATVRMRLISFWVWCRVCSLEIVVFDVCCVVL